MVNSCAACKVCYVLGCPGYVYVPAKDIDVMAYIGQVYGEGLPAKFDMINKVWVSQYRPFGNRFANLEDFENYMRENYV